MENYKIIDSCRICGSRDIKRFFDLGAQPLANSLPKSADEPEKFYPLSLSHCQNCRLVQLNETVDPKVLFSTYVWVTGTSSTARAFAQQFSESLIRRYGENPKSYVLEVASNDGTFLVPFKEKNIPYLGVDPASNIVEIANREGINTECAFFGEQSAKDIVSRKGEASIIFARNVAAHVADLGDFAEGFKIALAPDGILAVEVHYAKKVLEELQYDAIYHEHIAYHTLRSMTELLERHCLSVFDAEEGPISGGSLIVYASKNKREPSQNLSEMKRREEEGGTNEFASWENFSSRAFAHKEKLNEMLAKYSSENGVIIGYGASARSSTLLNFCQIKSDRIAAIADGNNLKHGRVTAGTHIPIMSPDDAFAKKPDAVFLMAWNFTDEIAKILREKLNFFGEIIVPLPKEPYIIPANK